MKISIILKTAMASSEIKNARKLSELTGITHSTVTRALNDENVGIKVIVELLQSMGYRLKAEVMPNDDSK